MGKMAHVISCIIHEAIDCILNGFIDKGNRVMHKAFRRARLHSYYILVYVQHEHVR